MDYGNSIYSGTMNSASGAVYADAQQVRVTQSQEERERIEKTLHHLGGRIEELRERLNGVLLPSVPSNSGGESKQVVAAPSPLTETLRRFQHLAQTSIDAVEDILNRLDV